jgi:predicted RNase H-like nuclease (RuvC/YqgF family)
LTQNSNRTWKIRNENYWSSRWKKKKLENDLYSQKEKNEELELLVAQKERQIMILENEVKNLKKILNTPKTDLEKEEALRKMKEDKLLSEIKDLKGTCDRLPGPVGVLPYLRHLRPFELLDVHLQ